MTSTHDGIRPVLLVLASTYPRWRGDPEPGFVHELCRRLAGRFEVIALVPDASDADPSNMLDGVQVVRYRYAPRRMQTLVNDGGIVANLRRSPWKWLLVPTFIFCQWWAARRIVQTRAVAVVHAHWLIPQGVVAALLARTFGVPFVVTSHGGDLFGLRGRLLTALKRKVASSANAMTVVSRAMRGEVERLALSPRELRVIPMGVDLRNRFKLAEYVKRSDSELLFVGRLVPKKGLAVLLEALPSVVSRVPRVSLTIAGFGPEEGGLRGLTQSLGLSERVHFLGAMRQDALPALYQSAALFVAPFIMDATGDQEGLPVALMEAIACGCPAVVSDIAGVRDLVGDGDTTALVPSGNAQALADAVVYALEHPALMREQAKALVRNVRKRIDWDQIADAYGQLLARVAG